MAGTLLPTTRAQVSGHRFLRRRVEHGLIFGDIRMIHDPLGARRRAVALGLVAVALIGAVCGLLAWLSPNSYPGDAPIVRSADGALYVRVDDQLHPVANVASARLIVGGPEEPSSIGDGYLAQEVLGVPVGITLAPSLFAPEDAPEHTWSVCHAGPEVSVVAGPIPRALPQGEAVIAEVGSQEWLVTEQGRAELPTGDTPQGRAVRRALGITEDSARWTPPSRVLEAIDEIAPIRVPEVLPEILVAGDSAWALHATGGIEPLASTQHAILVDAGASVRSAARHQLASYPDAADPVAASLPGEVPQLFDPTGEMMCASSGTISLIDDPSALPAAVELSGDSVATHVRGLAAGAVGVDTGHGYFVVSAVGQRHEVAGPDTFATLGVGRVEKVDGKVVTLLPEGAPLTREAALTVAY